MGFDLKKCLERDGGHCFTRLGSKFTLLYEMPDGRGWITARGHIDRNSAHALRGVGTGFEWETTGDLEAYINLPDPPRRVKVKDALGKGFGGDRYETGRIVRDDVLQALLAQHPDLEIELPPEK